jgi:hypothetical protein
MENPMAMFRGRADRQTDYGTWMWAVRKLDEHFARHSKTDSGVPLAVWDELRQTVFGLMRDGNVITAANALATLERLSIKDVQKLDVHKLRKFVEQTWQWHERSAHVLAARVGEPLKQWRTMQ